jgi:isopentenyl-diphosphate delta-isomerase
MMTPASNEASGAVPPDPADRERLLVELVDSAGAPTGACTVDEAHTPPGRRHRAFSLALYDHAGRMLLQQRAAVKTRFPMRWSNTCCGHPAPGEDVTAAALARLADELGITASQISALEPAGEFHYHAADDATGRVEDEWDHVLVATVTSADLAVTPNPGEVGDCQWVNPEALLAEMAIRPGDYTPWLSDVLALATRLPPQPDS